MEAALQKAIDNLKIRDVFLRSASAQLSEGFEPQYDTQVDQLHVQFKHVVSKTAVLELDEGSDTQQLFRVYIEFGARWVESPAEGKDTSESPGTDEKARIEGVIVAEYVMQEHPGNEALEKFALRNASYHAWPYWREFLSSQCLRMNLPKIVLPTVQFASN